MGRRFFGRPAKSLSVISTREARLVDDKLIAEGFIKGATASLAAETLGRHSIKLKKQPLWMGPGGQDGLLSAFPLSEPGGSELYLNLTGDPLITQSARSALITLRGGGWGQAGESEWVAMF